MDGWMFVVNHENSPLEFGIEGKKIKDTFRLFWMVVTSISQLKSTSAVETSQNWIFFVFKMNDIPESYRTGPDITLLLVTWTVTKIRKNTHTHQDNHVSWLLSATLLKKNKTTYSTDAQSQQGISASNALAIRTPLSESSAPFRIQAGFVRRAEGVFDVGKP